MGARRTWIRILTPPRTSCVISCTLFPLSEPQFPICEMRTIIVPAPAILGELNVCRGQAHGKRSDKLCFPAWCLPVLQLPMAPHCPQGSLRVKDLSSGSWTHQTLQTLGRRVPPESLCSSCCLECTQDKNHENCQLSACTQRT